MAPTDRCSQRIVAPAIANAGKPEIPGVLNYSVLISKTVLQPTKANERLYRRRRWIRVDCPVKQRRVDVIGDEA